MAGNNLFAYCNNRPVSDIDNDGTRCTEFDDGTGRWEYVDSTGFMHQGSGTKPITQKTSVKKQSPKPTTAAKKATAKNTGARDDFSEASTFISAQKTVISAIGAAARFERADNFALGVYGYAIATPFAIFSHLNDPYLTFNEKLGLSAAEVGIAVLGIGVTILCPAGWIGVAAGVAYFAVSTYASYKLTDYFDKKTGRYKCKQIFLSLRLIYQQGISL